MVKIGKLTLTPLPSLTVKKRTFSFALTGTVPRDKAIDGLNSSIPVGFLDTFDNGLKQMTFPIYFSKGD